MKKYDTIIITDLAAFYKVNLFNRIAITRNILVIFILPTGKRRNKDFFSDYRNFDHLTLTGSKVKKMYQIISILCKNNYSKLIIGGWNTVLYWIPLLFSKKRKNAVIVESSINESSVKGFKGYLKKLFLYKMSYALVPGLSNRHLLEALGFKGKIIQTHGVGLYNRVKETPLRLLDKDANKFLYVGRLSYEKNLSTLIKVFNDNPQWLLTIVGFGPQEKELKELAQSNIKFLGAIDNKSLPTIYQAHDVFILPSYKEPWGLVVEEAINNGIPVAVSSNVGAAEDWIGKHFCGLQFNPYNESDIKEILKKIACREINNRFRNKIVLIDFDAIEDNQIKAFTSI